MKTELTLISLAVLINYVNLTCFPAVESGETNRYHDPKVEEFLKTLPNGSNYLQEYHRHGLSPAHVMGTNMVRTNHITKGKP